MSDKVCVVCGQHNQLEDNGVNAIKVCDCRPESERLVHSNCLSHLVHRNAQLLCSGIQRHHILIESTNYAKSFQRFVTEDSLFWTLLRLFLSLLTVIWSLWSTLGVDYKQIIDSLRYMRFNQTIGQYWDFLQTLMKLLPLVSLVSSLKEFLDFWLEFRNWRDRCLAIRFRN